MRLVNTRTSGWSPDDQLVQFFSLLQQRPQEKIYVHCWLGDDRTGVFLAAYRMAFERWTPLRALQEMYLEGCQKPLRVFAGFRASAQSAQ